MVPVNCSDPVLIMNPQVNDLFLQSDGYFLDGHFYCSFPSDKVKVSSGDSLFKVLNFPYVHKIDKKEHTSSEYRKALHRLDNFLENSYFIDSDGVCLGYIWIYVPCGHCDVCVCSKVNSFVQRCKFAQEELMRPALFVTLTYNDAHLPDDGLLCRRDLQLFMKKLKSAVRRCSWVRNISPDVSACQLSWIYAGEYGKLGRPHYHLILFGFPNVGVERSQIDYRMRYLLNYAWRDSERDDKGRFVSLESYSQMYPEVFNVPEGYDPYSKGYIQVSSVKNSQAVQYALKYAFKTYAERDFDVCDVSGDLHLDCFEEDFFTTVRLKYKNKYSKSDENGLMYPLKQNFYGSSNNLGVSWLMSHRDDIVNSVDGKFRYMSYFDAEMKEVQLSSYYINKLFPSYSSLVPVEFRRKYRNLRSLGYSLIQNDVLPLEHRKAVCSTLRYVDTLYPELCIDYFVCENKKLVEIFYQSLDVSFDNLTFEVPYIFKGSFFKYKKVLEDYYYFVQLFGYICDHPVDFSSVNSYLYERSLFFSRFKSRSPDQIVDVGRKFARDKKVLLSKEIL